MRGVFNLKRFCLYRQEDTFMENNMKMEVTGKLKTHFNTAPKHNSTTAGVSVIMVRQRKTHAAFKVTLYGVLMKSLLPLFVCNVPEGGPITVMQQYSRPLPLPLPLPNTLTIRFLLQFRLFLTLMSTEVFTWV